MTAVRLPVLLLLLVPWRAAAAQDATASPHGALASTCTTCHGAEGWRPIRRDAPFDHAGTGFALDGAHGSADCRACHAALEFADTPRDCAGCHTDVHRGELGADCSRCHTTRSFVDHAGMVQRHQLGRFALTGAHAVTDCEACHTPVRSGALAFVTRPADCESCHLPAYQATTDPDHETGGFPRDCAQCHAATLWERARFNHSGTAFALTGAHRAVACDDCHAEGSFTGAPVECVGCHRSDYDATAEPPHLAAQFPVTCESCHSTAAWDGAAFDHAGTAFPLTGAHVAPTCSACHGDGVYAGKPTACVACHQRDYDGTTEPAHAGAGLPVTCESCHTTTAWAGARFDHDGPFFPIYSGAHRGQWESCATCHTNPSAYSEFSCLGCHEHSQARMDDTHRERAGYSYDSRACLSCHPRGDS